MRGYLEWICHGALAVEKLSKKFLLKYFGLNYLALLPKIADFLGGQFGLYRG
jgi:hypothetical protein